MIFERTKNSNLASADNKGKGKYINEYVALNAIELKDTVGNSLGRIEADEI